PRAAALPLVAVLAIAFVDAAVAVVVLVVADLGLYRGGDDVRERAGELDLVGGGLRGPGPTGFCDVIREGAGVPEVDDEGRHAPVDAVLLEACEEIGGCVDGARVVVTS